MCTKGSTSKASACRVPLFQPISSSNWRDPISRKIAKAGKQQQYDFFLIANKIESS
jgi:hypothetical protein